MLYRNIFLLLIFRINNILSDNKFTFNFNDIYLYKKKGIKIITWINILLNIYFLIFNVIYYDIK